MGIYYSAVNTQDKTYFGPPGGFANKQPGIYHPNNPFPGMLVMKLIQGYTFEIYNDCGYSPLDDGGYKDITEQVYAQYVKQWPEAMENE